MKMSVFDKVANAKVQGRGQKIRETGDFVVRIDACKMQQSNNELGEMGIVEFTVLRGTQNNPRGSARSWVQLPEKRGQTDPGNMKAFVMAILGIDDEEAFTAEDVERIYVRDEKKGTVMRVQTEMVVTKSNRDFCAHTWSPAEDGDAALAEGVAEAKETSSAPPAPTPDAPPPPPSGGVTKEEWLGGKGEGKTHPTAKGWEYHPDHKDWGCRKAQ